MFQETITIYGRAIQVPLSRERMHGKKTMKDHEEALKRSKDRSAVKLSLKHQFSMKLPITQPTNDGVYLIKRFKEDHRRIYQVIQT